MRAEAAFTGLRSLAGSVVPVKKQRLFAVRACDRVTEATWKLGGAFYSLLRSRQGSFFSSTALTREAAILLGKSAVSRGRRI